MTSSSWCRGGASPTDVTPPSTSRTLTTCPPISTSRSTIPGGMPRVSPQSDENSFTISSDALSSCVVLPSGAEIVAPGHVCPPPTILYIVTGTAQPFHVILTT